MKRNSTLLTALAAFLIPLVVIAFYYVTHKPFDASFALAFSLMVWRILLAGIILTFAGGLGVRLLPPLPLHPLATMTVQAVFGLGLSAGLILLIGSLIGVQVGLFGVLLLGEWWYCGVRFASGCASGYAGKKSFKPAPQANAGWVF